MLTVILSYYVLINLFFFLLTFVNEEFKKSTPDFWTRIYNQLLCLLFGSVVLVYVLLKRLIRNKS